MCSKESGCTPDGRRQHEYFLEDQHGGKHLAVQALECSAFDGHYTYTACEPFTTSPPARITNQEQVIRYLTQFFTHGSDEIAACFPGPSKGARPQSGVFAHSPAADGRAKHLTSCLNDPGTVADADGYGGQPQGAQSGAFWAVAPGRSGLLQSPEWRQGSACESEFDRKRPLVDCTVVSAAPTNSASGEILNCLLYTSPSPRD